MRALALLLCAGCSQTGTGVLLELQGSGPVDTVEVVGTWDGATQKSGQTMGSARALPFSILVVMPPKSVTASFAVTARLDGQLVGEGQTLPVKVEPHQIANASVTLTVEGDLALPDLAASFDLASADLTQPDLAQPPCSGASRCADGGICTGFEGATVNPPFNTLTRAGCTATLDSARACRGTKSIHLTLPNTSGMLEATVFEQALLPTATLYVRGFFYLPVNLAQAGYLMQAYQDFSPYEALALVLRTTGEVLTQNSLDGSGSNPSALHFPLGRWVCVEWKIVSASGATGSVEVSVDGAPLADVQQTGHPTQPAPPLNTVALGLSSSPGSAVGAQELWLDEVKIDTQPIGCFQ